jgi:hypothetical protein
LSERKDRARLGLSKYAAEAAEAAAEHRDKLSIAGKVRDVAEVHAKLWPTQQRAEIIKAGIFLRVDQIPDAKTPDVTGNVIDAK